MRDLPVKLLSHERLMRRRHRQTHCISDRAERCPPGGAECEGLQESLHASEVSPRIQGYLLSAALAFSKMPGPDQRLFGALIISTSSLPLFATKEIGG